MNRWITFLCVLIILLAIIAALLLRDPALAARIGRLS